MNLRLVEEINMRIKNALIKLMFCCSAVLILTNCGGGGAPADSQEALVDPPETLPAPPELPKNICLADVSYQITKVAEKHMVRDRPREGKNTDRISTDCAYANNFASENNVDAVTTILEKHDAKCVAKECPEECDRDCDNRFMTELYESYLIKSALDSPGLTADIIAVHQKIFSGFDKGELEKAYAAWKDKEPQFPVNQKNRDWSYSTQIAKADLAGLTHDPTSLLLSADFLKLLQYYLPADFTNVRDYMFNNILKKARGYRTNSKKGRLGKVEAQIGITSFDLDDLLLTSNFYAPKKWLHWGRTACDTSPNQGTYQHEVTKKFIPLKCGISGSTNFWIWTALFSGADLSVDETRLLILSAYIVLGADGGHSLMEVLSSATMSAIYMKHYEKYSKDKYLTPFLSKSNFAKNLYEVTKDINPIGNSDFICTDFDTIAKHVYDRDRYEVFNDLREPEDKEIQHRKEIESFFLQENDRYQKPFGDYTAFLDQVSQMSEHRKFTGNKLREYVGKYCKDSKP